MQDDTDLPPPSFDDLIEIPNTSNDKDTQISQITQNAHNTKARQIHNLNQISQGMALHTLDTLADSIANNALDTDGQDAGKTARESVAQQISNPIKTHIHNFHNTNTTITNLPTKMLGKQSDYSSLIAWKLRHGKSSKINDPSTWFPYSGEISEDGVGNKICSLAYGSLLFWTKTSYFSPQPLTTQQLVNVDNLIDEAVTEISNKIK